MTVAQTVYKRGSFAVPFVVNKNNASSAGTSVTLAIGWTPTKDNVLVAAFTTRGSSAARGSHAAPAGGTYLWNNFVNKGRGTAQPQCTLWAKRIDTGEPTSFTFSDPGASGSPLNTLAILEIGNVDFASLFDGSSTVDGGASNITSLTIPASTQPTTEHDAAIAMVALSNTGTFSGTYTNGFTRQTGSTLQETAFKAGSDLSTFSTQTSWTTARLGVGLMLLLKGLPN